MSGYIPLNHQVKGLAVTMNNQTWPDLPPLRPPGCVNFHIRRRGNCGGGTGDCSWMNECLDNSEILKHATAEYGYEGELVIPATVSEWPNVHVQFDIETWELPQGYYEGWFQFGCSGTCMIWFLVGQRICFTACPEIDQSCMTMPFDPACVPEEEDPCNVGHCTAQKADYIVKPTGNGGVALIISQTCFPEKCQ